MGLRQINRQNKKQTVGMRNKEGGTERNNSLAGRMKTKAEKEISLLSGLRECGEKKKNGSASKIDRERRSDSGEIEHTRDYVKSLLYTILSI